jgi:hypothetical protein
MSMEVRGLYRTPGWAFVTDDRIAFDVPEGEYRANAYTPEYDKLPTKEAYQGESKPETG